MNQTQVATIDNGFTQYHQTCDSCCDDAVVEQHNSEVHLLHSSSQDSNSGVAPRGQENESWADQVTTRKVVLRSVFIWLAPSERDAQHASEAEDHGKDFEASDAFAINKEAKNRGPEWCGVEQRLLNDEWNHGNTVGDTGETNSACHASAYESAAVGFGHLERGSERFGKDETANE